MIFGSNESKPIVTAGLVSEYFSLRRKSMSFGILISVRINTMSPEQQYVAFMDAAYAATDKETYYKCIQKAEQILKYFHRKGANETSLGAY